MGNSPQKQILLTDEQISKASKNIRTNTEAQITSTSILQDINMILRHFRVANMFQVIEGSLRADKTLLQFVFDGNFPQQLNKIFKFLQQQIQEKINSKSLNFLGSQAVDFFVSVLNFVLIMTDHKTMKVILSFAKKNQVEAAMMDFLKEMNYDPNTEHTLDIFIDQIPPDEKLAFISCLMKALVRITEYHHSSFKKLEDALFALYVKIFMSFQEEIYHKQIFPNIKNNIKIGSYFIVKGISQVKPSILEIAMVFLLSILEKKQEQEWQKIKPLPCNLFINVPVIQGKTIYDYILENLLYGLQFIHEKGQVYIRFNFNRILALKLINQILLFFRTNSPVICYYLEQLCLEMNPELIQRAFLYRIIHVLNQKNKPESRTLKNFLENFNLYYKVRIQKKHLKVAPNQILYFIDEQANYLEKEYFQFCEKYLYENILCKNMVPTNDDRRVWNQFLPFISQHQILNKIKVQENVKKEEIIVKPQMKGNQQQNQNIQSTEQKKQNKAILEIQQSEVNVDDEMLEQKGQEQSSQNQKGGKISVSQ